jgi:hypothetical protein
MYDPTLRGKVEIFVDALRRKNLLLENKGSRFNLPMPANYDLVIDIVETKDKTIIRYYYVDHDTKTLFWLDRYNMKETLSEIPGVREPGHISE